MERLRGWTSRVRARAGASSVRHSVTPAARRLRNIYFRLSLLYYRVRVIVYIHCVPGCFFLKPEIKQNELRRRERERQSEREREESRVSRKVICNKFRTRSAAAAHLMYTTRCVQYGNFIDLTRECRVQWKNNNNNLPERGGQQLRRFKANNIIYYPE